MNTKDFLLKIVEENETSEASKKEELIKLILQSPSLDEGGSSSQYLKDLRRNRNNFADGIIESNGGLEQEKYKSQVLTKAKNIQNQTRGNLGELLGRVALTNLTKAGDNDLLTDKEVFETPYGKRRVDVYWFSEKLAVETKMGYVTNSKSIRSQIKKDAYLLRKGVFNLSIWMLFKGGSRNLISNLETHGIKYKIGWPNLLERG